VPPQAQPTDRHCECAGCARLGAVNALAATGQWALSSTGGTRPGAPQWGSQLASGMPLSYSAPLGGRAAEAAFRLCCMFSQSGAHTCDKRGRGGLGSVGEQAMTLRLERETWPTWAAHFARFCGGPVADSVAYPEDCHTSDHYGCRPDLTGIGSRCPERGRDSGEGVRRSASVVVEGLRRANDMLGSDFCLLCSVAGVLTLRGRFWPYHPPGQE
jgi:hypothetical protein